MSLIDTPMALVDRLVAKRVPSVQPDDPVARLVARTTSRLRPDAAYQRRLRGRIMNQYVAMREGMVPVPRGPSRMGRLGRSVLYASFGLAVTGTAVAAASTQALPGDPLYGMKLRVEQVRMEIAPASVRPFLAAAALDERLTEVEQLATAGRWNLVEMAAEEADEAEATLDSLGGTPSGDVARGLERHRDRLAMLLAAAPPNARGGIAVALAAAIPPAYGSERGNSYRLINGNPGKDLQAVHGHRGTGAAGGTGTSGDGSAAAGNPSHGNGHSGALTNPTPTPTPDASSREATPSHTPRPHQSHSPLPSPSPSPGAVEHED